MNLNCCKRYSLLFIIILAASCSVISGLGRKHFSFTKDDKQKKLVYRLPKGPVEEKFRVGENDAKEQFYYFGDGSVFYVARHITWQTINKFRIDGLGLKDQQGTRTFSGKDDKGLYWKEIQFDDFSIGYGYVTGERLELFNEALNSVKIR
jgi:hypothetical protein